MNHQILRIIVLYDYFSLFVIYNSLSHIFLSFIIGLFVHKMNSIHIKYCILFRQTWSSKDRGYWRVDVMSDSCLYGNILIRYFICIIIILENDFLIYFTCLMSHLGFPSFQQPVSSIGISDPSSGIILDHSSLLLSWGIYETASDKLHNFTYSHFPLLKPWGQQRLSKFIIMVVIVEFWNICDNLIIDIEMQYQGSPPIINIL